MLALMHRGMMTHGKEWIRKNYGTRCVLIGKKSYESSATLNREETPQKSKYVEDYVSGELQSRKKGVKKNAWDVNNKMHVPKETVKYDKKSDE